MMESTTTNVSHIVIHDARFSSDEDYALFLHTMTELKDGGHCNFYAFCLLPGCAQLLIQEKDWTTKQVAENFASCCYHEDMEYEYEILGDLERFLTIFRFIHQIPVKAGLCSSPGEYDYSSWSNDYLKLGGERICKTTVPIRRFGFGELHRAINEPLGEDVDCLDYKPYE